MAVVLGLNSKKTLVVLLALMSLAPSAVFAGKYYSESDRPGYWWGKDPVEEEPQQPAEQPKQAPPKQEQKSEPKKYEWEGRSELRYSDFTPQQLWSMKPKELEDLFVAFKEQSVWQPTEPHVHDTYAMLNIVRRKAEAFTNVQQMVMTKYPDISTERDYPTAAPGKEAVRQLRTQEVNQKVATAAASDYGLIYFWKPGCPYCQAEDKILRYFIASRHFSVQPVNIHEQPEVAAQFNISITPSIVLIKRGNGTPLPISYGVISLDELEARVFNGVRVLDGETTPEQYGVADYEKGGAFDPTAPLR